MERIKVLLIEDNPPDAVFIEEMLAEAKDFSFDLEWKESLSIGLERLAKKGIDVILLDLNLPDSKGFNTFTKTLAQAPEIPIIILTGLDDETLAIRAVRTGAQDYLIKKHVNSSLLVRTIRYAIARRMGGERRFTIQELKEYDGKEGKPAYAVFKGKVYDISNSPLWKNGIHAVKHFAGSDLTESMLSAPHGEEILIKFHIVGELSKEKFFGQKLLLKLEEHHLHPILVHFSIAYSIAVSLLSLLYVFTGTIHFEIASYYMLALGFCAAPFAGLSGLLSWKVTYEGKMTRTFVRKIILTVALIAVSTTCFVWRTLNPDILVTTSLNYIYLTLVLSLVPIVTILGYDGGKIVYT
jgi:predicted heme/steroid binding protein/CheY-like chemotaxis protein/uncharacterized membrane protein